MILRCALAHISVISIQTRGMVHRVMTIAPIHSFLVLDPGQTRECGYLSLCQLYWTYAGVKCEKARNSKMKLAKTIFLLVTAMFIVACSSGSEGGSSSDPLTSSDAPTGGSDPAPDADPNPPADPPPADPPPAGSVPTVNLSTDNAVINSGGNVTLTWSSQNADDCTASGDWSGAKGTSGSETISAIDSIRTFTLNCAGTGGNALVMESVAVIGQLGISWQAPTENVDGSPVGQLDTYRIHYGISSGSYQDVVEVPANLANHTLDLVMGPYYIAMSVVDMQGDESAMSNEVLKQSL